MQYVFFLPLQPVFQLRIARPPPLPARSGSTSWRRTGRRAALHPLVPLPNPAVGAQHTSGPASRSRWPATPVQPRQAKSLGGRSRRRSGGVPSGPHRRQPRRRPARTGRGAETADQPPAGRLLLDLTRTAVDDVGRLAPQTALTGPAGTAATGPRWLATWRQPSARERRSTTYNAGVGLALQLTVGRPSGPDRPDPGEKRTRNTGAGGGFDR